MSLPKDPRMQMINMMYLVLMALLALNTSKAVLTAFRSLEISIEDAISQQDTKIADLRTKINSIYNDDQGNPTAKAFYDYMLKITEEADNAKELMAAIKGELEVDGGGYVNLGHGMLELQMTDNGDIGLAKLGPTSEGLGGRGDEIREAMNACHDSWMEMVNNDTSKVRILKVIDEHLTGDDGEKIPWSYQTFHLPLSAVMATLSELGSRLRASEITMYNYFLKELGADVISVDRMAPLVMAESKFVEPGKEYAAQIFLAAWNSTQTPEVYIGTLTEEAKTAAAVKDSATGEPIPGQYSAAGIEIMKEEADSYWPFKESKEELESLPLTKTSRGDYKIPNVGSGMGLKSYEGAIMIRKRSGKVRWYPFEEDYTVAGSASAVVSALKMNVMYVGVDNPMSAVVPGFKPDFVTMSISDGSPCKRQKGVEWNVKPKKAGSVKVMLAVKDKDGTTNKIEGGEFRVKRVPDPIATVGGKLEGGKVPVGKFKAQQGLIPVLKNFDFDFKFSVVSYELTFIAPRRDPAILAGKGPIFKGPIKNAIKSAVPKAKYIFTNIKVKGDDGSKRSLPSIVFDVI